MRLRAYFGQVLVYFEAGCGVRDLRCRVCFLGLVVVLRQLTSILKLILRRQPETRITQFNIGADLAKSLHEQICINDSRMHIKQRGRSRQLALVVEASGGHQKDQLAQCVCPIGSPVTPLKLQIAEV